ncbi:unnamed protein product [Ixodes pacificus]
MGEETGVDFPCTCSPTLVSVLKVIYLARNANRSRQDMSQATEMLTYSRKSSMQFFFFVETLQNVRGFVKDECFGRQSHRVW